MTANDAIKIASNEIGVTEYPPNSNNVKYNTEFYNGKQVYGSDYPWCCAFVWWVLRSIKGFPKTASCMTLGNYFKKEGRFFTSNPQIGDVVFFKFPTNNRWTNHVGLVIDVKGNEITTIEGNTGVNSDDNGGCVQRRKRSKNIVGYGRPYYDSASNTTINKAEPILKKGDRNEFVRAWQTYLITCGFDCGKGGTDGIFGNDTEKAVREYQKKKGLPITGVIDADDWRSVGR